MFSLVLALSLAMFETPLKNGLSPEAVEAQKNLPPAKPATRPWVGGPWTGEDADKGKTFAQGAFEYIPRKEYEAWQKSYRDWLDSRPTEQSKLVEKNLVHFELFGLADAMPKLKTSLDDGKPTLTASGDITAYGGSGTIKVEYTPEGRTIEIVLREVDIERTLSGIGIVPPVRVRGTTGKLVGKIEGDRGFFVGTEIRSGGMVSRIEMSIDLSKGTWSSTAQTAVGPQTLSGRLKAK